MVKDAIKVSLSDSKGLGVLTSAQKSHLLKRMGTPRVGYHRGDTVDWELASFYREMLQKADPVKFARLWPNVEEALHNEQFTKDFCDWEVTIDQINNYWFNPVDEVNFGHYRSYRCALGLLKDMFHGISLHPTKIYRGMDVSTIWSNPDASAGAIGRGSKKDNETACFDARDKIIDGIRAGVPFEQLQIPALPAHRAQISGFYNTDDYDDFTLNLEGYSEKDRLVWIVDGGTNLVECAYGLPLQEYLSSNINWYAGGKDPEKMRSLMRKIGTKGVKWLSIDYSKYDQTVPAKVIHDVFKQVIRPMFPDDEDIQNELKFIEYNFIHTKILLPGNLLFVKHRGIPSGSLFTQICGTLCNLLIGLTYLCSRYGGSEEQVSSYVRRLIYYPGDSEPMVSIMGDDNIWGLNERVDLDDWAGYVGKTFNMVIHSDKCADFTKFSYPEYLKRIYTPDGEKMNTLYLVVNTCLPERGNRMYDGYSPAHIVWGLFNTYRASFFNPPFVEEYLVQKMQERGGLEALKSLKPWELPGVLRGYSYKSKVHLYDRAKAIRRMLGVAA